MAFTTSQAKGLVIGATAGAGVLASLASIADSKPPSIRIAVGATIVAVVLYAIADWAPELAGMLALVVLTGAILTNGTDVANVANNALGK